MGVEGYNRPGHPFHDAGDGEAVLLVRGDCECGWVCYCPEGASWPACPKCERQVLPPKPRVVDDPRYGAVAFRMHEIDAVIAIQQGARLETT